MGGRTRGSLGLMALNQNQKIMKLHGDMVVAELTDWNLGRWDLE